MLHHESPRVRIAAARMLADLGDRAALPVLIELLTSDDIDLRIAGVRTLRGLTGKKFKFVAYDTPAARQKAVAAWKAWLAGEGAEAELHFPVADSARLRGRTLLAVWSNDRVVEIDDAGKVTWGCESRLRLRLPRPCPTGIGWSLRSGTATWRNSTTVESKSGSRRTFPAGRSTCSGWSPEPRWSLAPTGMR